MLHLTEDQTNDIVEIACTCEVLAEDISQLEISFGAKLKLVKAVLDVATELNYQRIISQIN